MEGFSVGERTGHVQPADRLRVRLLTIAHRAGTGSAPSRPAARSTTVLEGNDVFVEQMVSGARGLASGKPTRPGISRPANLPATLPVAVPDVES